MPLVLNSQNGLFVIGERINPSGNKKIAEAFENSDWDIIADQAGKQFSAGAHAVDVNVGPGPSRLEQAGGKWLRPVELMRETIRTLEQRGIGPLALDSIFPEVLEAGLEAARERVFLNSVTGVEKSMSALLPLITKRQIPFIGLVIDESGIPGSWQARVEIAGKIIARASEYGISKKDIVIDCVALPLRFYPGAIFETLESLKAVRESWGVRTSLGISNVSFGLKQRGEVNAAFLRLALACGLDVGMLNPFEKPVMETVRLSRSGQDVAAGCSGGDWRSEVEKFKEKYYAANG